MTPAHAPNPLPDDPCGSRSAGPPGDPPRHASGPGPADEADLLADLSGLDELSDAGDLAELLGADPEPEVAVRLSGGDDLIAALPALLGFHPADSLVLVAFGGRGTPRVGLTVRVDLPYPDDVDRVCSGAVSALVSDVPVGAAAVIVGGGPDGGAPAGPLPRPDVAEAVCRTLVEAGVEPYAVLWAAGTDAGRPWACYDLPGQDCGCRGEVPGAAAEVMAAAAVRCGREVLPDRAAVGRVLASDGEDALRRRARLRAGELETAASRADMGPQPDRSAEHRETLRRAIADAAACRLAVDDATVLRFCAAFDSPDVRAAAVRASLGPDAPAAEQLWAALSRAMPEPERAEPAALFAVCAYLRGDGALASIAVERALEAFPGHRLAGLVDAALQRVVGPPGLRRMLEQTYGRP